MIPSEYTTYFMTMAAVGATLFGLIFVAISIAPESVTTANAPLERQIKATTAYIALLNPLVISLLALVPHQQIGTVVIGLSLVGLLNTLVMTFALMQNTNERFVRFRHSLFILASFILYGYEAYFAILLLRSPSDNYALFALADLLILMSVFGVIRAWDLIGVRQFHLRDWFSSLRITKQNKDAPR